MYSPKHLFDLYRRSKADLAFTPLFMKKWSLSNVLSMIVRGISYRIEAIFNNQFRQISWAASGMLDYCKDLIVTSWSFYPLRCGNASFLILSKTRIPKRSMISMTYANLRAWNFLVSKKVLHLKSHAKVYKPGWQFAGKQLYLPAPTFSTCLFSLARTLSSKSWWKWSFSRWIKKYFFGFFHFLIRPNNAAGSVNHSFELLLNFETVATEWLR